MRSIYSPNYCDACLEGLWLSLLTPLSLIDNITQTSAGGTDGGSTNASLALLPLAEFRTIPVPRAEAYTIFWYGEDEDVVLDEWTNRTSAVFGPGVREFGVEVRFWSEQIRVDRDGVLVQKERVKVV